MQLLASADLHGDHALYKWLVFVSDIVAADVVVLAGDLLGVPGGYENIEEAQRSDAVEILKILDRVTLPILYIMGNDDLVELSPGKNSIRSVNRARFEYRGLGFVGYQYSLPFMGGLYEKPEHAIREDLNMLEPLVDDRTVFITHSPAYGILDLGVTSLPAGSESIRELIDRRNPMIHIHGHIHSQYGRQGRHYNVAAAGQKRAMVIDTDTREPRMITAPAV